MLFEPTHKPKNATLSASILALICTGAGLAFIRDDEARKLLHQGQVVIWPHRRFPLPLHFASLQSSHIDPSDTALLEIVSGAFRA